MADKKYTGNLNLQNNQILNGLFEIVATLPATPLQARFVFLTSDKNFYGYSGTAWINLSQIITNAVTLKGEINASGNPAYPTSPTVGDQYIITTAGTVGGTTMKVGDELIYSTSGWFPIGRDLLPATQALAGFLRLATQAEVATGTDATTAISPATLAGQIGTYGFAKKYRTLLATLAANTPTIVTHNLGLANADDLICSVSTGGEQVEMSILNTSVNSITITSNIALTNITVVCVG